MWLLFYSGERVGCGSLRGWWEGWLCELDNAGPSVGREGA